MNITVLDSRTYEIDNGFHDITLEFGMLTFEEMQTRFYIRVVRSDKGQPLSYPHGVRNEAYSRSYVAGMWADTLKRYDYIGTGL